MNGAIPDDDLRPALSADPLGCLARLQRERGDVAVFRLGGQRTILLGHPDSARDVLTQPALFAKGGRWDVMRPLLGQGLLMSDGERWRRDRTLLRPAFAPDQLARMVDRMVRTIDAEIEAYAGQGGTLELSSAMARLTLKVVVRALFGDAIDPEVEAVQRSLTVANGWLARQMWTVDGDQPGRRAQFDDAVAALDGVVMRLIDRRRAIGPQSDDLLDLLIAARDASGAQLTDPELRDQVMTLLVAGHETTANGLTWAWDLLLRHPEALERLVEEGRNAGRLQEARLEYAGRVFREALRLEPPIWLIPRTATAPCAIGGATFYAGDVALVCPYLLHRRPDAWPDPTRFDPDRFDPSRDSTRHPFVFLPFGGGSRSCLGQHFALIEGRLALAMIAAKLVFHPAYERRVRPLPLLTLRTRHGVAVRVEVRP